MQLFLKIEHFAWKPV